MAAFSSSNCSCLRRLPFVLLAPCPAAMQQQQQSQGQIVGGAGLAEHPPARPAEQTLSPSLQQVFTRIGCARVILARSSANPLNHQTTSKLQTAVVLEAFAKAHQEMDRNRNDR